MIKTIMLSMCLAASLLSLDARAQDTLTRDALAQNDRQYTDGPVTEVNYLQVEYGHFARVHRLAKFDMEADHGSHEESWANHRLQGLPGQSKITGSAQYIFISHF